MALPVIPKVPAGNQSQNASTLTSATLQNAAALTGNGTAFDVTGMATVIFELDTTGFSGTVTFEGSINGTDYVDIYATEAGTTTVGTGTGSLTTDTSKSLWVAQVAGLTSVLTPITRSAGSVTVTATASPVINVGSANPTISAVTVSAGTAAIGSVKLLDSGGTNKATIGADGNLHVTDGGTSATLVTGSSAAAIKTAAGRLCKVSVNSTVTSAVTIYDDTSSAHGTILCTIPTTAAVGSIISPQFAAAVGIYVAGGAGSPALTVGWA